MPTLRRDAEIFTVPDRLAVLALRDVVIFPHVSMPLLVGRPASLAAVDSAMAEDRYILLVTQRSGDTDEPAAADLYRGGVVARIAQLARAPSGAAKILVEGLARVRVTRYVPTGDHLRAQVVAVEEQTSPDEVDEVEALARRVVALFEEYVSLHRRIPPEVVTLIQGADTTARQAFGISAHLSVRVETRQALLETSSLLALYRMLAEVLRSEIELLRLERKIDDDVRGSLFQNQREFYLQEQLKAIHRELGTDDGEDVEGLEAQIAAKHMPEAVQTRALREVRKLRRMSPLSPESTVARNYVDWLLALPWTDRSDDVLDVTHARRVLDEDHYGLEEVKDRILDYIGVLSLVGRMEGPILCLVGPPGVGKTSLGRSIARALGRKFVRMSLGGVRDEAEIRGHRRTYIGSMPGRVIQAMRRAEVVNPVILLDEVDKLGQDYRGDPSAALLEVLDPEQNRAFNDHFLEVDYDLSQVLFVTTANYLPHVPEPLRDRMEIIRLSGYLDQEKLAIARQFLVPRQLRQNGLQPESVTIEPEVLGEIIQGYTREAGVRELERRIARIARKLARRRAEQNSTERPAVATESAEPNELVAAVTSGPARVVGGRGKLQLTGTLGDVMKESASAALSYARSRAGALGIDREFHRNRDLHVHIPAGATPKDGPSAGIAIATAIVSALTGLPVRGDVAMTGEITLRGRVLPIGGLKEKAVAAHRNHIKHVLIPHGNTRDLDDIPPEVRSAVSFHPVRTMDEVLKLALEQREAAGREASTDLVVPAPGMVTH
jgi:ATP-dependent Lon protease